MSGFADHPTSGWALLMDACYAPAAPWAPLVIAVTVTYLRRRVRGSERPETRAVLA